MSYKYSYFTQAAKERRLNFPTNEEKNGSGQQAHVV
jgi:hypothetical protein